MAQSFVTTYKNHFRRHESERTLSLKPIERFANFFPGEDIWIRDTTKTEDEEETKSAEEAIKMMFKRRMQSVYKVDYCYDQIIKWEPPHSSSDHSDSFENQLLEYCRQLYESETKSKIAAPLPTARKLYGYIRPSKLYTPLTCYQRHYGNVGYRLLKGQTKKVSEDKTQNATIFENFKDNVKKPVKIEILPCRCTC